MHPRCVAALRGSMLPWALDRYIRMPTAPVGAGRFPAPFHLGGSAPSRCPHRPRATRKAKSRLCLAPPPMLQPTRRPAPASSDPLATRRLLRCRAARTDSWLGRSRSVALAPSVPKDFWARAKKHSRRRPPWHRRKGSRRFPPAATGPCSPEGARFRTRRSSLRRGGCGPGIRPEGSTPRIELRLPNRHSAAARRLLGSRTVRTLARRRRLVPPEGEVAPTHHSLRALADASPNLRRSHPEG